MIFFTNSLQISSWPDDVLFFCDIKIAGPPFSLLGDTTKRLTIPSQDWNQLPWNTRISIFKPPINNLGIDAQLDEFFQCKDHWSQQKSFCSFYVFSQHGNYGKNSTFVFDSFVFKMAPLPINIFYDFTWKNIPTSTWNNRFSISFRSIGHLLTFASN